DVVVSDTSTDAVAEIRSAISFTPDTAKCAPAVVALAGAVSLRLSRMNWLNCAAVNTDEATAVIGADQAITHHSLERHDHDAAAAEGAGPGGHPVLRGERVGAR